MVGRRCILVPRVGVVVDRLANGGIDKVVKFISRVVAKVNKKYNGGHDSSSEDGPLKHLPFNDDFRIEKCKQRKAASGTLRPSKRGNIRKRGLNLTRGDILLKVIAYIFYHKLESSCKITMQWFKPFYLSRP